MIKIANTVYTTEDITLQDGTEVTLKPLPIARLRRFMKAWRKISTVIEEMTKNPDKSVDEEDASIDIFITCCGIALEKELGEKVAVTIKNKQLSVEYRSYLEDVLDMATIYRIMEVCGGMKLNEENPKDLLNQLNPGTS